MLERSLGQIRLLLLIPIKLPDAINLLIGGVAAFLLAFLLTFFVKAICYKVGWLDKPAARRVHTKAVPRLGGVAIYVAFVIASLFFYTPGPNLNAHANELTIYWLLIAAGALLVLVHAYDDILGLGPWPKLIAQTMAVIIILAIATGIILEFRRSTTIPSNKLFAAGTGLISGFTSMLGNLAGAFSNLYFLAMRMPKNNFIGTAAWLFLVINYFKLPFQVFSWKNINEETLQTDLFLLPAMLLGFLAGIKIVAQIKDDNYRKVVIALTLIGAIVIFLKQ